ncbi:MAG: VIT and VWA domain-containing protein, partial [Planctomycetota bacterium]|nr:VIT and VWA domain-containing protein [Planctomycetota bacterium]
MNSDSEFRVAAVDGVVLVARGIGWREVAAGDMVPARKPLRVGPLGRVDLLVRDIRLELGAGGCFTPLSASSGELAAGDLQIASAHEAAAAPFLTTTSVGEVEVAGVAQLHAGAEAVRVRLSKGRGNIRALDGTTKAMHAGEAVALTRSGVAAASASETPERALRHAASQPVTGAARAEGRGAPGIGRLLLKDSLGRDMRTLEVQELRVTTTILGTPGGVALTEIEQTFFNPAEQQAEGTFYFPVPAGASLARLAMWVGETLVEGELVERVRARHVYEEIVRRMQDPALMEWQEGNIFKTRIFPIPAKGAKRILIAYTQTLPAQDGERCYVYPLGSQTDQSLTIGRFSFEATIGGVNGGSRMPVFCQNYPEAQVATGEGQATVKLSRERFRPRGDVVLRFYSRDNAALSLAADRRAGEDGFFLLAYRAPSGSDAPALQARLKRDLVFMLDTSLSRRADDYRAQLRALRVMLEELRPDDRFALLSFDVAVRAPDGFVTATAQNINAAMSSVEKLIPLGATDLAAACGAMGVFLQKHKPRSAPDVVMLSDGIATFGKTESADVLAAAQQVLKEQHARFHALAMGTVQDRLVLSELARTSGGLFRSLAPGSAIESEAFRLALALECELQAVPELTFSGVEVTELYPSKPGSLLPGQELIVLGRYKKAGALEVSVKQGESAPVTGTFTLPDAENTNVFIPRLWAREKMETLLALPQDAQTAQQVAQLSQEFTIISPYTSFLVLENEQQYAQYGIDRRLRRRYWEEQGGMRSVPPPPPATTPLATPQPGAQPEPQPAPAPRASEEAKAAPPKPEPPRPFVETLDLTLLSQRFGDGREVATALSSLSLEVYYRYLQLRPEGGSAAPSSAAAVSVPVREAVPALENAPQGPIQTRDFQAQPEAVAPLQQTDVTPSDLVTIRTGSGDDDALSKPAEEFLERIETSPGTGGGWGGGESVGFDAGEGRGSFGYRSFGGGRRLMVVRHGGSRATESGVDYSLRWLSYAQHQNGRWGGAGVEETSLSLLALLGAGHTEKVGEYKETVRRAVAWLRSVQDANGRIGSNTYEHALGTLALSEAAGMANMPETRAAAQKATEFLGSLQAGGGTARAAGGAGAGWAYAFNKAAGDTGHPLVTAFAVLALKSAKVAGLHVEPAVFDGAIRYLDLVQADDGAVGAAGKPKGSEIHLLHTAGLGVARQCLGYPKEDARVAGAADHLLRMVVGKPMERDGLFVRYFGTLLVFQFGGEPWRKWNEWHKAERIEHQVRTGDLAGSWAPEGIWIFEREPSERKPDAAQGLAAALVKVRSAPRAAGEYVGLAQALSEVADMNVLQRTAAAAGQISPAAEVFVRTRIGMLLLERKQWDEGAAQFKTAYELSERAENVLALYVGALRQGPRPGAALDTLLSEAAQGRLSDWRNRMIATLIFDPALRIEQPRQLLEQRLPGSQAPYVELKAVVGQAAKAKGRGEDAAELLGAAYRESGRQEKYLAAYIEAARGAGRAKEALDLLLNEAGSDARWSKYRRDQAAEL